MEKIISIQPAPRGLYKRWKQDDAEKPEFEEEVLFIVFSLDDGKDNDMTVGPNITTITFSDIREGYHLLSEDINCIGIFEQPLP